MQTDASAKQLVVERIKNATNILVTVSHDPSVDELSAALGLTLLLNKLDKHATAVFSGKVPPAIEFLQPGKTFENTVDSLRDFIIALDKEKADRLRYKVEDDVVRIFITPYKTIISQKDLQFSQGDFNVELVLALGVEKREDLDTAITAHGRILHDAPVVTINNKADKSSLGAVDWSDASASSLCEMLMGLSEALGSGLLDEQISTALLTGIVAATERFRNTQTSPKVMTMAAQLMAAGANQQLIAAKLEEGSAIPAQDTAPKNPDGSKKLTENKSEKLKKEDAEAEKAKADGEMLIDHDAETSEPGDAPDESASLPAPTTTPDPTPAPAAQDDETALDEVVSAQAPTLSVDDLKKDIAAANEEVNAAAATTPDVSQASSESPIGDVKGDWRDTSSYQPAFGGTLNATTDEAEQDKLREQLSTRNHTLLTHDDGSIDTGGAPSPTVPPSAQFDANQPAVSSDPFASAAPVTEPDSPLSYEATPVEPPSDAPTLSDLEAQVHQAAAPNTINDARAAVDAALGSLPFDPANQPLEGVGAQPFGDPLHAQPASEPPQSALVDPVTPVDPSIPDPLPTPTPMLDPTPPVPVLPPLPDFSTLPPLPGEPTANPPVDSPHPAVEPPEPAQPIEPAPNDPGQFKLPGQS